MLIALTLLAAFLAPQAQTPTLAVACSAQPSTIIAGADALITAKAVSLENRRISYSVRASSGRITPGGGYTAILHTSPDSAATTIVITCNAVDDHGTEASNTTTVTVRRP